MPRFSVPVYLFTLSFIFSACSSRSPLLLQDDYHASEEKALLSVVVEGKILGDTGTPVSGMPGIIETKHSLRTVETDRRGQYRANIVQEQGEDVGFTFINAIGDRSYYWHKFEEEGPQTLDLMMDYRGHLSTEEKK